MGEKNERESNVMLGVLMLPWLAHGHLFPFLELAKRLSHANILVHFCSTPINIGFIKEELNNEAYPFPYIKLVELQLPDLPPHLHSTKYLPPRLMPALKTAFDRAEPAFRDLLHCLRPDLLVYDFVMPWAPHAAHELDIPSVLFLTTAATTTAFFCHHLKFRDREFPFVAPGSKHMQASMLDRVANGISDGDRFLQCINLSSGFIAIRTFKEIESDRIDYVSSLVSKEVVPVGPLIPNAYLDEEGQRSSRKVMDFLGEKDDSSVVFASFGSEYFLSEEEMEEVSMGLELSKVSFIWVIRFPKGGGVEEEEEESVTQVIPCGFIERTRGIGLVLTGWAPQREILTHPSIGGFLSHCGWSSIMEAMRFGVPMVALPMQLDQPINAKLVAELGIAVEVKREVMIGNNSTSRRFKREDVAKGIRDVMVNKEGHGERMKAKEIAEMMARKGNEEIENLVGKITTLCSRHQQREITL